MTIRTARLTIILILTISSGLASVAAADPSPTGREPKLLWTPARQAVWSRMKADFEKNSSNPRTLGGQWYKLVKDNAECGCRYGDTGLWATFMYQWTGDPRYVELAWVKISEFVNLPVSQTAGNYVREWGIEYVVLLDWLWPGLNQSRRDQLTTAIGAMLRNALTGNQYVQGYRMDDSDQVVGTYFAIALFQLTHPENPDAKFTSAHPQTGGLMATGVDQTTARNSIKWYVEELARGGEWMESASYNLGTVTLLLLGAEAVKTATHVDYFPEVTEWTPLFAKRQIAFWTPDLEQSYQWGDEEHPRENGLYRWTNLSGLTAGLVEGTSVGAQLQEQLLDLVAKYKPLGYGSMEPIVTGRGFFTFNPYAPTSNWRVEKAFHAAGTGLLLYHSGFTSKDSLFAAHVGARHGMAVDHSVRFFNDFELWRNGEWVITHPRGYAGAPNTGPGTNSVLMQGFGDMFGFKETVGVATGSDYAYQAATTGGSAVWSPYYDPPPVFVHEWTRSVLYVAGSTDTIIVHDRAHVADVLRQDRFYKPDQDLIIGAPSAKQWLLHTPVQPAMSASAITWSTPGGQTVRWTPLLPLQSFKEVYDERALQRAADPAWKDGVVAEELKYHVRVWPAAKRDWDTFLNVIQVGAPGSTELLVQAGGIDGVRVSRPGGSEIVALFNATPSSTLNPEPNHPSHISALRRAHLRTSGFTFTWTARADTTDVYIADLDKDKTWNVEVDDRSTGRTSLGPSDLLTFEVKGIGNHKLVLSIADGQGAAPPEPARPSDLRILPKQ